MLSGNYNDLINILVLKNAFDTFDVEKKGSIGTVMIGTILSMLGIHTTDKILAEIIAEVDEDGNTLMINSFCGT